MEKEQAGHEVDVDITEALGLDRLYEGVQGVFAEGWSKAREIASGVGDRISALFDDAEEIIVRQNPDGTGTTWFKDQKDVGQKGTPASAPEPGTGLPMQAVATLGITALILVGVVRLLGR